MKKWLKRIDWKVAVIAAVFTAFVFQAKKRFVKDKKDSKSKYERIIKDE